MKTAILVSLIMSSVLVACGGSESGGGAPATANPVTQTPVTSTDTTDSIETTVTQTADLNVSADFDFGSSYSLDVKLLLPDLRDTTFFLNVCAQNPQTLGIDYQQCLIRTSVKQGQLSQSLSVASYHQSLVAEVVFIDEYQASQLYFWELDSSDQRQAFNIN